MTDNKMLKSSDISNSNTNQWLMVAKNAPKSKNNINKNLNTLSKSKENLNNNLSCETITHIESNIKDNINISELKENLEISCDTIKNIPPVLKEDINNNLEMLCDTITRIPELKENLEISNVSESKETCTIPESKENLEISNVSELKETCIIPELEKNINKNLKISCDIITSIVSESRDNIDNINLRKYEIEFTINKICIDKATLVKNAFMTAYNIIKPKNAKLIAEEEYKKTYALFYDKLSRKYELEGLNIRISDLLEYQLPDEDEKIIVEEQNNEENLPIYQVNNKTIDIIDKQNQINIIARNFAKNIIINQEINNRTHLEIDCKDIILGYVNNKPIFPNKFLDPTYVKDSTFHTSSHHCFKKEFFDILKEHLGDNHNLHVKFSKDLNNNMNFHIYFVNRRIMNKK